MKKKKNKQMNQIFYLFIIILILVSIPLVVKLSLEKPRQVEILPYDYKIKPQVGFMLDSDILHFGGGPTGSELRRNITLSSDFTSIVQISYDGPGNIIASDNDFYLDAAEEKDMEFKLTIPEAPDGNYSGEIIIEFFEP